VSSEAFPTLIDGLLVALAAVVTLLLASAGAVWARRESSRARKEHDL
jgi:hypothetical protein